MKVLVTGGAGFIGTHVVKQLLMEDAEVVVVDNLTTSKGNHLPKGVKLYKENIEGKEMKRIFKEEAPDYLIHLAAQVSVRRSMEDPYADCISNIVGTLNLLRNCITYKVKKIIFASSAAVYGEPSYLPIDELHPKKSISYYSLSKNIAEEYITLFHKQCGLKYSILRFSNVYGPGQNPTGESGVISIFSDQILKGVSPVVYGGSQIRDFIYVKDVAKALSAATGVLENGIYNISSNTETSIKELLTTLIEITGINVTPKYLLTRKGDIMKSCLDNRKAIEELNWKPEYSLIDGLKHTVKALKKEQER
ncbi:NAD-dependent epimerase/dehydratase family protein [Bacillus sp. B190/17]|uniref:NAD-dependent epimerase/dehydratase family protein n=1 Tax=Bacillus lumedeiriae TaxID=3058829 RepID=A0ABW8IBM8_9BACI